MRNIWHLHIVNSLFVIILFLCLGVLPLHLCMCTTYLCAWWSQKSDEGVRSSGTRVTNGCEVCVDARNIKWVFWRAASEPLNHRAKEHYSISNTIILFFTFISCVYVCTSVCAFHTCVCSIPRNWLGMAAMAKGQYLGAGTLTWILARTTSALNPRAISPAFRLSHHHLL